MNPLNPVSTWLLRIWATHFGCWHKEVTRRWILLPSSPTLQSTFSMLSHSTNCQHTDDALFDEPSESPYNTFLLTHASQKEIKIQRQKPITADQKERLTKEQTAVRCWKSVRTGHLIPIWHLKNLPVTAQSFAKGSLWEKNPCILMLACLLTDPTVSARKKKALDQMFLQKNFFT